MIAYLLLALLTLAHLNIVQVTVPQTITVGWDPNDARDLVTNYILSYGTSTQAGLTTPNYANTINVGQVLQASTPVLQPNTYYLAVQAQNAVGISLFSNEVSSTIQSPDQCSFPTGANAVSAFITNMLQSGPNIGTKVVLYFQLSSPNSPIVNETISVDGVVLARQGTFLPNPPTDFSMTNDGAMWFTSTQTPGTHTVSFTATNLAGCSATVTKNAFGDTLTFATKAPGLLAKLKQFLTLPSVSMAGVHSQR